MIIKRIYYIFIIISHLIIVDSNASNRSIVESGLFDIVEDSIKGDCSTFLIENVRIQYDAFFESMRLWEYNKTPEIDRQYSFTKLPNLHLYIVYDWLYFTSGMELLFKNSIVNCNNFSVYYFGGNVTNFNKVMKQFLPKIVEDSLINDIVSLYLYSLSTEYSCHPLFTLNLYKDIWISYNLELDNELALEFRRSGSINKMYGLMIYYDEEKDINIVNKLIDESKVEKSNKGYSIEIYTWEDLEGKIEFWQFEISKEFFKLVERKTITTNMGPYKFWVR